jgi:HEAT repeat protein
MKDPSVQVRQTAVNMINLFGQNKKESFEVFEMGLKDTENQVRIRAAHHAYAFQSKSWGPLEEALKSVKDSNFRLAAVQGLANTNYRAKTGVPILTDCLKDSNQQVKLFACNLLGNIGADAASALPALRELIKSSDVNVRSAATNAVKRIESVKK